MISAVPSPPSSHADPQCAHSCGSQQQRVCALPGAGSQAGELLVELLIVIALEYWALDMLSLGGWPRLLEILIMPGRWKPLWRGPLKPAIIVQSSSHSLMTQATGPKRAASLLAHLPPALRLAHPPT